MGEIEERLKAYYETEMAARAGRPLGRERESHVRQFAGDLRDGGARRVLEVGCGAGRDVLILASSGCAYTGVDLSVAAVRTCLERGLDAVEASATSLPFDTDSFDAAWSMSTLMHLPGDGFSEAVQELGRVVRPTGIVEIGVWGHLVSREWTHPDGRYFRQRTDDELVGELTAIGEVEALDTWDWADGGGHYQCARLRVGGSADEHRGSVLPI